MKTKIFFLLILIYSSAFSQETKEIDVSNDKVPSKQTPIEPGNYLFQMINLKDKTTYDIVVEKNDIKIAELQMPNGTFASLAGNPYDIDEYKIDRGQELIITIKAVTTTIDASGNTSVTEKTYKYSYQTEKRGEWRTTFGFNFIYLTNQETYFSKSNDDGTYVIFESNNKEKFQYHPAIMFTWLNKKSFWQGNLKYGYSGGIGYNFKTSISVFTGISLIYNENITITTGLAFHNQKRLTSNYSEGDVINENLTFDQLHTDYIRVNPFVSIALRLDKNPFK